MLYKSLLGPQLEYCIPYHIRTLYSLSPLCITEHFPTLKMICHSCDHKNNLHLSYHSISASSSSLTALQTFVSSTSLEIWDKSPSSTSLITTMIKNSGNDFTVLASKPTQSQLIVSVISFRLELIPCRGGVSHSDPSSPLLSISSMLFL